MASHIIESEVDNSYKLQENTKDVLPKRVIPKRVIKIVQPTPEFIAKMSQASIKPTLISIVMTSRKSVKLKSVIEEKDIEKDMSDELCENNPIVVAKFFEKNTDILPVDYVEIINLVLFEHDNRSYYREPIKNKLFTRLGPKSIGPYIGRWNSRDESIHTDIPDSDSESTE